MDETTLLTETNTIVDMITHPALADFSVVQMIQNVLPHMHKQRSGAIVNFSSIAAPSALEGSVFYGASKWR